MGRALQISDDAPFLNGPCRQFQQWLDSYVSVRGHEPMPHEIEEFLNRNGILSSGVSLFTPAKGSRAAVSREPALSSRALE